VEKGGRKFVWFEKVVIELMAGKERRLVPDVKIDTAVIGAGVVGLAVARSLALQGREVFVFEAEKTIGEHTSSRNSEVIHSGIYLRPGSLKARLCVEGKEKLYEYCEVNGIAHKQTGKIIVAASAKEVPRLQEIKARSIANGVNDLSWLSPDEVQELEPMVRSVRGLYSPSTGIVDSHGFMKSLKNDVEREGASVVFLAQIVAGEVQNNGIVLALGDYESSVIHCKTVINCAGLSSQEVAKRIVGVPEESIDEGYYTKGHYYALTKASPFSHLVYPVPEDGGLGVHVTLDLEGRVRFGPDVSPIDSIDYCFDRSREERFYTAIRTYYPELQDGDLQPGYTGIRPKLRLPKSEEQDFVIKGTTEHGVPGLVNLFGIESPGLTSSLAIADHVAALISK
jgi:L-2-hydroxyglutarate oxidase LhgO